MRLDRTAIDEILRDLEIALEGAPLRDRQGTYVDQTQIFFDLRMTEPDIGHVHEELVRIRAKYNFA